MNFIAAKILSLQHITEIPKVSRFSDKFHHGQNLTSSACTNETTTDFLCITMIKLNEFTFNSNVTLHSLQFTGILH